MTDQNSQPSKAAPAEALSSPGNVDALVRRIELARAFIAKEHADPRQEEYGDWINPAARPAHDALCLCLQDLATHAQRPASAESIARTICLSYGRNPEELSDPLEMCDAHNRPVSLWRVYEEQAEAILAAYAVSSTESGSSK